MIESPWGKIQTTGSSHLIAVPAELAAGFSQGHVLGVFTSEGLCAGFETITHNNQSFAITAYADDPTTAGKDGFEVGEPFVLKLFKPESGLEYTLQADFDPNLPQSGYFAENGISAIKSLESTGIGNIQESYISVSVYPNPSTGVFRLKTLTGLKTLSEFEWEVSNTQGLVVANGNILVEDFILNLSSHPKGIYYLKITKGGLQTVKKLVLQ